MMFDATITGLGETVTIYGTATSTDALGNSIAVWSVNRGNETAIVTPPLAKDITLHAGRIAATDRKIMLCSTSNVTTGDRIKIDGVWYDTHGTKEDWKIKFMGTTEVYSILLKRVK